MSVIKKNLNSRFFIIIKCNPEPSLCLNDMFFRLFQSKACDFHENRMLNTIPGIL